MELPISKEHRQLIKTLVKRFEENTREFHLLVNSIRDRVQETESLYKLIHSLKWRVKEPFHLKDKLERKIREAMKEGKAFEITEENFFAKVNDLAGVRLLHLYTRQMSQINTELLKALDEGLFNLIEGPIAKTWDTETEGYFNEIGIKTEDSESLYTSVHYVIESNSKTKFTCEIQVRTLAEELWGEVSHFFNYPRPTKSIACAEQIKVLARVTSSCSRLVDSVYRSFNEFESRTKRKKATKP
jgi:putative GTP pyrophosphokinase